MADRSRPEPQDGEASELLTYGDVARETKVPERTIRRWVAAGDLPALQLGRHRRIFRSDLAAFLRTRYVTREAA